MGFIKRCWISWEQLIKMGILTKARLRRLCPFRRKRQGKNLKLGQILIELGLCDEKQIGELSQKAATGFYP